MQDLYSAMKLFNDVLYKEAIYFKMAPGMHPSKNIYDTGSMVTLFTHHLVFFHCVWFHNTSKTLSFSGDMLALDNVRCLHGREGYEAYSERHLESSYLDWDEARCRRRRLEEAFGEH